MRTRMMRMRMMRVNTLTNDEEDDTDRDVVRGLNRYQSRKGCN
jgi:hypothetical protein